MALPVVEEAYNEYGDRLVVTNSPGEGPMAVRYLAKGVSPDIRGFIVTTRFKHTETKLFMRRKE